ncbi:MAG TPA: hypothetical protein VM597_23395 [Gemmataceae bacterium]|jgi:hypothetical protein|nr:hypothetical protein [Gemmataceae bacterium]
MANRLARLTRRGLLTAGVVVTGLAGGCALPHGSTQGDPLLGNFHRPIVPTPMPERGGLGPNSPAYDAGARIGVPGPDVPGTVENSSGFLSLPPLTGPGIMFGAKMPFSAADTTPVGRAGAAPGGARLHDPATAPLTVPAPAYGLAAPNAVAPRPKDGTSQFTSATAFIPAGPAPQVQLVKYELLREPGRIATLDEGQQLLNSIGAKGMRTEQLLNGDWSFCCTIGSKPYEGRGGDAVEALRQVAEQVQRDR